MDSQFEPVVWPEDKRPEEAADYKQCEICSSKSRIIWGEGNPIAPIYIVLDNPGVREDQEGNEYICGTRQTLQTALHDARLTAADVYLTYLLKCRPLRQYNKDAVRAFSKPFLLRQINTAQPECIVCLGDTVVQAMFDDQDAHVKNLRGSWHILLESPCMVSYHPLAVRRRPNLMHPFLEDWRKVAESFPGNEK